LERRVAEMDACVKSRDAAAAADSARGADARAAIAPAATAPEPRPLVATPAPEISASRRAATWTLRGSAAALLVSSAVFGALSWNAYQDFQGAATPRAGQEASNRYATDTALTWTFAASGVACAVVSYFVGRHR